MTVPVAAPPPPAERRRPATVTVAFGLQLGVVAILLALAALTVVEAVVYDGLIDRAAELTNADPEEVSMERASNVQITAFTTLAAVVLLALFAATAFPVRSGSNVARILTCVGAGIPALCCVACGGFGTLAAVLLIGFAPPEDLDEEGPWLEETPFYDKLFELESTGSAAWLGGLVPALIVLGCVLAIVVAILLLVPPSNRYYRPPLPPLTTPGYPFAYPVPPGPRTPTRPRPATHPPTRSHPATPSSRSPTRHPPRRLPRRRHPQIPHPRRHRPPIPHPHLTDLPTNGGPRSIQDRDFELPRRPPWSRPSLPRPHPPRFTTKPPGRWRHRARPRHADRNRPNSALRPGAFRQIVVFRCAHSDS
ncbi:hypothetical protein ACFQ1L_40235 [Phytohabitans flavus]|uniref:hypothetical protein n=1 Tax=Phytohabitans flavus TaxID=1076124 RepID=UPI0015679873|nr:hypothetical protein [Phytohabitans flavus]